MSATLRMTSDDLTNVSGFLAAISEATQEHDVFLAPYGRGELKIGDTAISFSWDADLGQYVLDDRVGD